MIDFKKYKEIINYNIKWLNLTITENMTYTQIYTMLDNVIKDLETIKNNLK